MNNNSANNSGDGPAPSLAASPLSSVHTPNLPDLLHQLKASLLVSTYQAGKLIAVRADGKRLNTHFRSFRKPMGLVANRERLLLGTEMQVWEFRNMPAVSARLDPPQRHDAVYLARNIHFTGNIDIHEMALDGTGELWVINTLFSCLCTLDRAHSFVPRWRPRFVSHLAPEDRCHLNGLCLHEGRPRYLTALGATDQRQGWRENKRDGGVLLDFDSGEVVAGGLSMPHSPRWYRNRLWLLESGKGSLCTLDVATGRVETVARLPGFTRGLDFVGPFAFIGLSRLRKTTPFTDIPLTDAGEERVCGVWVVHIETGRTVALLRFTTGVQEIFAVQALRGIQFPEIVMEGEQNLLASSYALPDAALREVRLA